MVLKEVFRQEQNIIIEQPKEFEPLNSNAKSHRGIILSLLNRFNKDASKGITYTALELKTIFEEALTKYNEIKKEHEIKDVIYSLVGWKGKDLPEIFNDNEEFILEEHRKDKEGNVETITHKVTHSNVNKLLRFIKTWKIQESRDCYAFSEYLGYKQWKDLWKERKIYFEDYYYPIKCLESLRIIDYSAKGVTKRLK